MSRREASRPGPWRRRLVLAVWLCAAGALGWRAARVQVVEAPEWRRLAAEQHRSNERVEALRGAILDRDGTPLAVSRERFRVGVAGREVADREAVARLLHDELSLSTRDARRAVAAERSWFVVPGAHSPTVRERLGTVRGVYLEPSMERYYPHGSLARGLLGGVGEGRALGGIEQAFDSVLRGRDGSQVVARDPMGNPIPGETFLVEPPLTGGQVVLTIDADLQEIATQALDEAIAETGARGGDVLVTDPETGEILAMVSMRGGAPAALAAVHTPYEPGSTLKPFTVAGLLREGLASLNDTVDAEEGVWRVEGRTLRDVHAEGRITIADALRLSSNVGIAKAAQALSQRQQYEILRDFGFGAPTGVPVPGESAGRLRRPVSWSRQSAASLAIGYEIAVTPIQMAMAYGALANGGLLMEPRLVREVRDSEGRTRRFEPRPVRRVVSPEVARAVSRVLVDVVEDGTGTSARLGPFRVAGKSGTTRAIAADGGYEAGAYLSSFVGFFPAEDPQLLVVVKLDRPEGDYYGGQVAAPVTRATLEAALAARATPIDRGALLRVTHAQPMEPSHNVARFASQPLDPRPAGLPVEEHRVPRASDGAVLAVPDVEGLPVRLAVRRLHAAGLRVSATGVGEIAGTAPRAGTLVAAGDTVRLRLRVRGSPR